MRYGSVCSGIEAATVAWHSLGWKAAWLSEIEPFPSAVLAHHYPNTPNLGDMTFLSERIASGEVEAPDVFCGGTPCQAFSVAGLRNSLDDHRGNLSLTFCEIANAIDSVRTIRGEKPAIIFWENVPGVLNTKDNAFGCFLAGLAGESDALVPPGGRWTDAGFIDGPQRAIAWRVLDAQYFGLAQRRKRVFVVASARNDFDPATILFEWDGLRRDIAPSREKGKDTPAFTSTSFANYGDGIGTLRANGGDLGGGSETLTLHADELANCLQTSCHDYSRADGFNTVVYENHPADSRVKDMGNTCTTMTSRWGTGGGNVPFAVQTIPIHSQAFQSTGGGANRNNDGKGNGLGIGKLTDPSNTITTSERHAVAVSAYAFDSLSSNSMKSKNPISGCNQVEISKAIDTKGVNPTCNQGGNAVVAPTLTASNDPSRSPQSTEVTNQVAAVYATTMAVRRLTPVECERLQGFPDNYTNIPWRKKPESPDGPRYKALGNSWAVPVVAWIGKRINDAIA